MAIFHFSAKVISRTNGSSAVASAAYRSAERLHDQRLDRDHDFTNKSGVVHSEVMLPDGAPERLRDRSTLWNEVQATELRKDAPLSPLPECNRLFAFITLQGWRTISRQTKLGAGWLLRTTR